MAEAAGKTGLIFAGSYARPPAAARVCPYALSGPAAFGSWSLWDRPPHPKKVLGTGAVDRVHPLLREKFPDQRFRLEVRTCRQRQSQLKICPST